MARRPGTEDLALPAYLSVAVRDAVPPVHPSGRRFIAGALAVTMLGWRWPAVRTASLLAAAAVTAFFREPGRVPPTGTDVVVAPSDGQVTLIEQVVPPVEFGLGDAPLTRISISLSLTDAHVQRCPVAGQVETIVYTESSPSGDPAGAEQNTVVWRTPSGTRVAATQIAGVVVRRIVCSIDLDDHARLGDTYGMIRFGSRVDTWLPQGSDALVRLGQRAVGGETVLATLPRTAVDGTAVGATGADEAAVDDADVDGTAVDEPGVDGSAASEVSTDGPHASGPRGLGATATRESR